MFLLPACMVFGWIAPAAVSVDEDESDPYASQAAVFAPLIVTKPPLAAPIPLESGATQVVDLDVLLSTDAYPTPSRAELGADALPDVAAGFEPGYEAGPLVLGDENEIVAEQLFDAQNDLVVDDRELWDKALFDVIAGVIAFPGDGPEFDDFVGPSQLVVKGTPPTPVVPEPGTGLLLGSGLALLAFGSRRR